MTRHLRGDIICANALEVPLDLADAAVLEAVKRDLLRVEVLETALFKAITALKASDGAHEDQAGVIHRELAHLEGEVARLAQAIAAGGNMPALLTAMQER